MQDWLSGRHAEEGATAWVPVHRHIDSDHRHSPVVNQSIRWDSFPEAFNILLRHNWRARFPCVSERNFAESWKSARAPSSVASACMCNHRRAMSWVHAFVCKNQYQSQHDRLRRSDSIHNSFSTNHIYWTSEHWVAGGLLSTCMTNSKYDEACYCWPQLEVAMHHFNHFRLTRGALGWCILMVACTANLLGVQVPSFRATFFNTHQCAFIARQFCEDYLYDCAPTIVRLVSILHVWLWWRLYQQV